jgi:transposase
MRQELSDAQWQLIAPHLPPPKRTGRPRADDRKTLEGILWVLRSGARWQDVPREYGSPTTCWRRLREWEEAGVWETLWRVILSALQAEQKLDWAQAFLDGSFVPAKRGALESD